MFLFFVSVCSLNVLFPSVSLSFWRINAFVTCTGRLAGYVGTVAVYSAVRMQDVVRDLDKCKKVPEVDELERLKEFQQTVCRDLLAAIINNLCCFYTCMFDDCGHHISHIDNVIVSSPSLAFALCKHVERLCCFLQPKIIKYDVISALRIAVCKRWTFVDTVLLLIWVGCVYGAADLPSSVASIYSQQLQLTLWSSINDHCMPLSLRKLSAQESCPLVEKCVQPSRTIQARAVERGQRS